MGTVELECGDDVAVRGSVRDGLDQSGCSAQGLCRGDNTE